MNDDALTWDSSVIGEDATSNYWNENIIASLVQRDDTKCSISHRSVCWLTSAACRNLAQIVVQEKCFKHSTSTSMGCIPVAISIPEGIYLPISVATVYAMNHEHVLDIVNNRDTEAREINSFAILPLDPNQGLDRLKKMMQDAQPGIILTSGNLKDTKKLEAAITQSARDGATFSPVLVDFVELLANFLNEADLREIQQKQQLDPNPESISLRDRLAYGFDNLGDFNPSQKQFDRISHIVFTSGSTGKPKACVSSILALEHYLRAKNTVHAVSSASTVLLASSLSFDPCLSDVLASLACQATLALAPPAILKSALDVVLTKLSVTHILCTPTLWSTTIALGAKPNDFPDLQVVALGGEPISAIIQRIWARHRGSTGPRLLATFGTTEAVVYQTAGEIHQSADDGKTRGQNVGIPFPGLGLRICRESTEHSKPLVDVDETTPGGGDTSSDQVGEVVLYGKQIDSVSSYLNQGSLSKQKFIEENGIHYYKTGDRGFIDKLTGNLHILGRCKGDMGMVKINGVRLELRELEVAVIDDEGSSTPLFVDCMVVPVNEKVDETAVVSGLIAYVVLSPELRRELCNPDEIIPACGVLCTGALLLLLHERCRLKAGVVPNAFVAVPRMFLSPTGKRDRSQAPPLSGAITWEVFSPAGKSTPLRDYGRWGCLVAEQIQDCLNLQPSQQALVTTKATFHMLGGDSLAATRVVRALYALFHNVDNNRFLGGKHGILDDDRFSPLRLVQATLGSYVDFLDQQTGDEMLVTETREDDKVPLLDPTGNQDAQHNLLGEALLGAVAQGQALLAMALLQAGAPPDGITEVDSKKHRLSKTSSRNERKVVFASAPLHYACLLGMPEVVRALIKAGARTKLPDASGIFPLHLAVVGGSSNTQKNQMLRWETVKIMLDEAKVPLTMKDGNKQTLLHCAARSGQDLALAQILVRWNEMARNDPKLANSINWRDRWSRTPVHWAVLNWHPIALKILLDGGCLADPPTPKRTKATSAALESPIDLCERLYGNSEKGETIAKLIRNHVN